jgi:hypothetical protein
MAIDARAHFRKIALATLFVALVDARASQPDLESFHESILGKETVHERALRRTIAESSNQLVIEYGAVLNAAIWDRRQIAVCWKNAVSADQQAQAWVKDSIDRTWQKESMLRFSGWTQCPKGRFAGIQIKIEDVGPHTTTLGRFMEDEGNQMVLNFKFESWGLECSTQFQRESCIRAIAVHEFGHAIGFTHEQNRADSPGECKKLAQGSNPDQMLTPYDPDSVMNYCNKVWNNDGFLSSLDIQAVQQIYGKPR